MPRQSRSPNPCRPKRKSIRMQVTVPEQLYDQSKAAASVKGWKSLQKYVVAMLRRLVSEVEE